MTYTIELYQQTELSHTEYKEYKEQALNYADKMVKEGYDHAYVTDEEKEEVIYYTGKEE